MMHFAMGRCVTDSGLGKILPPALRIIYMAPSGAGKGSVDSGWAKIENEYAKPRGNGRQGLRNLPTTFGGAASAEALMSAATKSKSFILVEQESGVKRLATKGKSNSTAAPEKITAAINELSSAFESGVNAVLAQTEGKGNVRVLNLTFSMIMQTTPDTMINSFSDTDYQGGLVGRCCFIHSGLAESIPDPYGLLSGANLRADKTFSEDTLRLIDWLVYDWYSANATSTGSVYQSGTDYFHHFKLTREAMQLSHEFRMGWLAKREKSYHSTKKAYASRLTEVAHSMALLIAVGMPECLNNTYINEEAMRYGIAFAKMSFETLFASIRHTADLVDEFSDNNSPEMLAFATIKRFLVESLPEKTPEMLAKNEKVYKYVNGVGYVSRFYAAAKLVYLGKNVPQGYKDKIIDSLVTEFGWLEYGTPSANAKGKWLTIPTAIKHSK
jgi:hypothetical protein